MRFPFTRSIALPVFLLPFVLGTPLPAADQAPLTQPVELSWEDCVKSALSANPDIREARFRLDSATARRNAAFGGFLPKFSASVDAGDSGTGNSPEIAEIEANSWSARLTASQSLFSGFSTLSDFRRNLAAVRRQKASFTAESADLRNRLRRAFVGLLYAQENIRLLETISRRRNDNADLVRLRYDSGREDKGTSLRVTADSRAALFDLGRARRALSLARRKLAMETGLGEFSPLSVKGNWEIPPPPGNPDLDGLVATVPAVMQSIASTEEARASLWGALSPFWPSIDASASLSRNGPEWIPANRSWGAGLSVSYSIFNGTRDANNALAARAEERAAREALASASRAARVALEESFYSYFDAYENVSVRQQYLEASRVRADIGRAQYANGLLSFSQWDLIETEIVDSERGYLSARRDALYMEADWNRALGRELGQ